MGTEIGHRERDDALEAGARRAHTEKMRGRARPTTRALCSRIAALEQSEGAATTANRGTTSAAEIDSKALGKAT